MSGGLITLFVVIGMAIFILITYWIVLLAGIHKDKRGK